MSFDQDIDALVFSGLGPKDRADMTHDIFIKIDGISGESQDALHPGEIEVIEWHWSITRFSADDVMSREKSGDLLFRHRIDRASPALAKYCRTGQRISKAVLVMRYAGGTPREFLRLSLFDVLVNRVVPGGDANSAAEAVYLSFVRVNHEYVTHQANGEAAGTSTVMLDMQRKIV